MTKNVKCKCQWNDNKHKILMFLFRFFSLSLPSSEKSEKGEQKQIKYQKGACTNVKDEVGDWLGVVKYC